MYLSSHAGRYQYMTLPPSSIPPTFFLPSSTCLSLITSPLLSMCRTRSHKGRPIAAQIDLPFTCIRLALEAQVWQARTHAQSLSDALWGARFPDPPRVSAPTNETRADPTTIMEFFPASSGLL